MPNLSTKKYTEQVGVRLEPELADRVRGFAESLDLGLGAAVRMLAEMGLEKTGTINLKELSTLYFNARSAAIQDLAHEVGQAVDRFREGG